MLLMSEVSKVVFAAVYRAMLLMLEVSKVHTGPSIHSNVTHVESGVHSCIQSNVIMSEVLKETQNTL